jgi:membrane fusion protein (multidrug efflux system)
MSPTERTEPPEGNIERHVLRAPYAGTLGLSQVDLGDYIDRGDPIVEISNTGDLELRFALPQRYVADLAREQPVLGVVGRCGPRFEGRVIAIDPRVDPRTRMVGVRAAVPNEAGELHPGMAVRIRVVVGQYEDAIMIPQEAIVRQGTKHIVYIVDSEDRAHPREITVGDYYLDGAHVLDGLEAGEEVVVAGHQKLLQPGLLVVPSPDENAAARNPVTDVGRYGPTDCESL